MKVKKDYAFCSWCEKMVKVRGVWQRIITPSMTEVYKREYSSGICPNCYREEIKEIRK